MIRTYAIESDDLICLANEINSRIKKLENDGWAVKDIKYQEVVKPLYFSNSDVSWHFKTNYSALIILHGESNNKKNDIENAK